MNLLDSNFLCLDIGTSCVRGISSCAKYGEITKSEISECESMDTVFAIKSVVDDLEQKLGRKFDKAYITGNFGKSFFDLTQKITKWNGEHKISISDIQSQISQINIPDNFYPMHIIPSVYNISSARDIKTPIGITDHELQSIFSVIAYEHERMNEILSVLHRAHIQAISFFDPQFLQHEIYDDKNQRTLFIDMGAQYTSASIWTNRGCMWHTKINHALSDITNEISKTLNIDFDDANRIKHNVANLIPHEMDRFTPADTSYEFSRADVNDIIIPHIVDIIGTIKELSHDAIMKYNPNRLIITGGGTQIEGVVDFFENAFGLPGENKNTNASIDTLNKYVWRAGEPSRNAKIARINRIQSLFEKFVKPFKQYKRKQKKRFIPIMPSTLCFNMHRPETYSLFNSGGISIIHVDIMDGLYVNKIAGNVTEIKTIRSQTKAHLHVHLMTESPTAWANDAINAGADTVIVSTNTAGVKNALHQIHAMGKRCGIALNPESSITILKPILREIDEVMIMAVTPGAAGQKFNTDVLRKISALAATRKKYGLKFLISVDGGIDDKTAQMCWNAGADLLVSGSYLARATDFPLAVQSLLKK